MVSSRKVPGEITKSVVYWVEEMLSGAAFLGDWRHEAGCS